MHPQDKVAHFAGPQTKFFPLFGDFLTLGLFHLTRAALAHFP